MVTIGTVLATEHWWGEHVGVVVGWDLAGRTLVAHCSRRRGCVAIDTLDAFRTGKPVRLRPAMSRLAAGEIVARAQAALGRPYSFRDWNCEDFVAWVLGNPPRSKQREDLFHAARVGAVIVAIGFLFGR